MSLQSFYTGLRPFSDPETIINTIIESKRYDSNEEDISSVRKIQLFDTSKQRTFLVSTSKRLYKILDDRRKNKPKVLWSRKIEKITNDDEVNVIVESRSERSDNLIFPTIAKKKNLVSKKLFTNISVQDAMSNLLINNS